MEIFLIILTAIMNSFKTTIILIYFLLWRNCIFLTALHLREFYIATWWMKNNISISKISTIGKHEGMIMFALYIFIRLV